MIDKMDKMDLQDTVRAIRDGNKDCIPNEVIYKMADRFLGWKLPEPFRPDNGISFEPIGNKGHSTAEYRREPTGTNLFDREQAVALVRYMLDL
jgi:hypothetical protein